MSYTSILILFGALQGFILFFSIGNMTRGNTQANRIAALFILFIAITLIGRFAYSYSTSSLLFAKLLFVGDFVIFFYGPLLYLYFLRLFRVQPIIPVALWVHFAPLMVFSVIVFPFVALNEPQFIVYGGRLKYVFYFLEGFAIAQNFFYVWVNAALIRRFQRESLKINSVIPQMNFYKALLGMTAIGLFFWTVSFALRFFGPEELRNFLGYQLVWISLSALIIGLGYFTLRNPEVFTGPDLDAVAPVKPAAPVNAEELLRQLDDVMKNRRPYLEPKLTLPGLSEISGIQVHLLSRIINDAAGKNFFEFVNSYRVEEFKRIATPEHLRSMTVLALALEAGFNSKTTFNTAFKKITNTTPREYLRSLSAQ